MPPRQLHEGYTLASRWVAVESGDYIGNQHSSALSTNYSYDNTGWNGFLTSGD